MKKVLSSYVTMLVLLALFAVSMATATWIEDAYGTTAAKIIVYYSPVFFLLQFMLIINFVMIAVKRKLLNRKRWGQLLLHFAFIIILSGALITHLFGQEGVLHLREGEVGNRVMVQTNKGNSVVQLPFEVELIKFTLTRYPGSMSPSSYESDLRILIDGTTRHERVYMNNVLDVKGYRFYQASYDADEKGTVLSVNRDVAGRRVTYFGYLLLLVGCIVCLSGKNGRVRTLYGQLKRPAARFIAWMIFINCLSAPFLYGATAQQAPIPSKTMTEAVQQLAVPSDHAKRFGALPVQSSNGRIIPVNTLASELLRKVHKDTHFGTLNADRFLLSLLTLPEMWMNVPLISYKNNTIADFFNIPPKICAYSDMFNKDGTYKLQDRLNEAYRKAPTERSALDKDLMKLDEQVNIVHQLFEYQLIRLFPKAEDPDGRWYAPGDDLSVFSGQDSLFVSKIFFWYITELQEALKSGDRSKPDELLNMISIYQSKKNNIPALDMKKISIELLYNRLEIFRWCKIGYLVLGGFLLAGLFILFLKKKKWVVTMMTCSGTGVLFLLLFHLTGMGMRWYIGGYAPWSNSYETMVFLASTVVIAGLLFSRQSPVTFALATLFAGIILFVSGLNRMDPHINPLVPVLKSPWLMFHVAILMAAYGFFGISFLIGWINLWMMALSRHKKFAMLSVPVRELSLINEMSLVIGLNLMTIGTFIGAVWANESWGRYWGWDPKETWALITLIIYVIVTHLHLLRKGYKLWLFNLCSVLAFASVLMTYFGVNYFLSGMHSYGQSDQLGGLFLYLCAALALILLPAVLARKN